MHRSSVMSDGARKLLYRWFVQYNPLYLVSAMLVLGGTILTSRGLAGTDDALYGPLGVAGVAEVYALALIGGAALLTRIGQRRPAVMLAVLTALYQCDLTLHTETCVQLGTPGLVATSVWLGLFVVKLGALAWAVKARLSRGAWALAGLGASCLAFGPYVIEQGNPAISGAFIAAHVFALGLLAPTARVTTTTELDAWGETVFARTTGTIWSVFGALFGLHLLFWSSGHDVKLALVIPALAMLFARYVKSEAMAWVTVAGVLLIVYVAAPIGLPLVALLATVALAFRAYGRVEVVTRVDGAPAERGPYRHGEVSGGARYAVTFEPLSAFAKARYLTGSLASLYVALATAFPAHGIVAGAIVTALAIALAATKPRLTLLLPALGAVHAIVTSGYLALIPRPETTLGWGATTLALGFVILGGALAASYRLRGVTAPDA